jgi:hypothetical protein
VFDMTIDDVKAKIAALYRAGIDFDSARSRLQSLQAVAYQNPETRKRYDDIMARGGGLKAAVSGALEKVRDVYAWIKSNLGVNLGVLPLVPIAVLGGITAATAAAIAWNNEANNESRKLEIIATLPPEQRARALSQTFQSTTGNLANLGMWLALGAAAIFLLPKLIKDR